MTGQAGQSLRAAAADMLRSAAEAGVSQAWKLLGCTPRELETEFRALASARQAQLERLDLKWARLSGSDLAAILNAVGGGFFTVRYPDPMAGENVQISCCCGDRTTGILRMEGGVPVWTDVEMSWTER